MRKMNFKNAIACVLFFCFCGVCFAYLNNILTVRNKKYEYERHMQKINTYIWMSYWHPNDTANCKKWMMKAYSESQLADSIISGL